MNRLISYEKKNTPVHRLSGFTKLVFFIMWCLTSALTFETGILIIMLVMVFFIYVISQVRWCQVSTIFAAVMFFMTVNLLGIFLFAPYQGCELYGSRTDIFHIAGQYTLTREQLFYEFNVFIKYFTVIPGVFIFLTTTDPSELASSINGIGVPYSIAYSLEIALRYIPDVQDEFRRIRNTQQARGIEMSSKGRLIDRIKNTAAIIFPLLFSTMERIDVVSSAMELRGFGKKPKRTWYSRRPLEKRDYLTLAFIFAFFVLTIVLTYADGSRYYNPFG